MLTESEIVLRTRIPSENSTESFGIANEQLGLGLTIIVHNLNLLLYYLSCHCLSFGMAPKHRLQKVKDEGHVLSKREQERIKIVVVVLERSSWSLEDFPKKLSVSDHGLDATKQLCAEVGIDLNILEVFGPRGNGGWKLQPSKTLTEEDVANCWKLHDVVYGHGPSNDEFSEVFLWAWLVAKRRHLVNWSKFAFDVVR